MPRAGHLNEAVRLRHLELRQTDTRWSEAETDASYVPALPARDWWTGATANGLN